MAATSVPLWVAVTIAVGSPLLAFLGLLLGQLVTRRTARELDTRWQREETMRLLRWAADHAARTDAQLARLGVAALEALSESPLVQAADQSLLKSVLRIVVDEKYHGSARNGGAA
ncbi:MAG TPA: hypothetical protein PLZ93_17610 [Nocardioides sp.]|uniref:hypothetical protein n=1 Tax=uncultured Nocardioides sp. TaxID=198441 RepID=UPI000EC4D663|nr:hypothetical protein [uncultured Nocardioides sp.]HCB07554.1 hypothetical protein [Nocardioides sp.]HRD62788.1 hypothetical protein [Nocardioides sp.]HRI97440.1 hypothetical protein [Nocardioides sp.]HRK46982.1 hypothetical protein [Nocardioides sp.]